MTSLIARNLLRRPARSLLTAAGVALAVAFAVGSLGLTMGFRASYIRESELEGTHIIVSKINRDSSLPKPFDASVRTAVAALPGIEAVSATLWDLMEVDGGASRVVFGWEESTYRWDRLPLVQGKLEPPGSDSAYLGILTAEALEKQIDDSLEIDGRKFRIAGIYELHSPVDNSAVIIPLSTMQELSGMPGKINNLNVRLLPDTTAAALESLKKQISTSFRGLRASKAGEIFAASSLARTAVAMSSAVSLLAMVIGTLGLANAVLMGVSERRSELGLLLALGWRRSRILLLVLGEAAGLSILGALAGIVAGVSAVVAASVGGPLAGRLAWEFPWWLLAGSLITALLAGIAGGLLPAWHATRLEPAGILRST